MEVKFQITKVIKKVEVSDERSSQKNKLNN